MHHPVVSVFHIQLFLHIASFSLNVSETVKDSERHSCNEILTRALLKGVISNYLE